VIVQRVPPSRRHISRKPSRCQPPLLSWVCTRCFFRCLRFATPLTPSTLSTALNSCCELTCYLRRTHLSPITVCAHCVDQSKCGHRCTDALLKELEQLRIEVERQREERVRAESYTHALLDQLAVLGASSSSHRHRHPHQHIRSQHRQPFQDEPVRPTTPTSSSAFASAGEEDFSASPICHRSLVFLGRC
jgi:hypothetical protein